MNKRRISFNRHVLAVVLSFGPLFAHAELNLTVSDEQQINALVDRWNNVLNRVQDAQPQSLYADQVDWFGKVLPAQQVIASDREFLAKNKDYRQSIVSTLNIQPAGENDDRVLVRFVKRAGVDTDNEKNYPAELQLQKNAAGWRIVSETDAITRRNQHKNDDTGVAKGKFDGTHISYAWMSDANPRTGGACTPDSDCDCTLWNSDPHIKPVSISQCLAETIETLAGLDDSGRDRALVYPEWWTSALRVIYLYDIQQNQWIKVVPDISYNINIQETHTSADIVKRDVRHPGKVNIEQSLFDEALQEPTVHVSSQTLTTLK